MGAPLDHQPDLFGAARSDIQAARGGGILPTVVRGEIREAMMRRKLRQIDVARAVGLSRSQTGNILSGRFGASMETARRLTTLFGLMPWG